MLRTDGLDVRWEEEWSDATRETRQLCGARLMHNTNGFRMERKYGPHYDARQTAKRCILPDGHQSRILIDIGIDKGAFT
jgi:hypothetical protein